MNNIKQFLRSYAAELFTSLQDRRRRKQASNGRYVSRSASRTRQHNNVTHTSNRVVAGYMGSGIKGLQEGGIRDHSLRIRDHGLGIGISAVFHGIRDQTDS